MSPRSEAQSDREVNDANNPLAPLTAVGLQNYFIPSTYGVGETSNNLLLRPVLSTGFMIIRATLPVNTVPDPNQPDPKSGLGDANIFDIFLLTRQGAMLQFGAGPLLVARTATSSVLGTGKWQAGGAAVVVFLPDPNFLLASLVTYSHSFAGDDDRPTQSVFSPQYILNVQIGGGFYVRSTPTWTFDFVSGNYVMPFGAGIGKVSKIAGVVVNSYIEPQYSILHHGVGQPAIQIASGLNFQFPSGQ